MKLTRVAQDKQIRAAFLAHYSIEGWEKPLAVTLTLKRALQADGGWVTGNEDHYSGALKHALNVVNHRCFGPRWRSKGHRVKVIAVLGNAELPKLNVCKMGRAIRRDSLQPKSGNCPNRWHRINPSWISALGHVTKPTLVGNPKVHLIVSPVRTLPRALHGIAGQSTAK